MVRVLFFGILAAKTGCRETALDMEKPALKVEDFLDKVRKRFPDLPQAPYMVAVNEEKAEPGTMVKDGDEVAIMPPFSGGLI